MPSQTHQQIAETYFRSLNPLAQKICNDINEIADAYAHLWTGFNVDEQHDVINVTLIKPDIVLKYLNEITISSERNDKKQSSTHICSKEQTKEATKDDADSIENMSLSSTNSNLYRSNFNHIYLYNGKDLHTYSQIITALRYNQDDLCGIYRDEHSEPFNFKTKSQMNLNLGQSTADAHAKIERAQKRFPEIKLSPFGAEATMTLCRESVVSGGKKGVDHMPELSAKLAIMRGGGGEHGQDSRKSFMSKLFSGKDSTTLINVPSPKLMPIDTSSLIHDDDKECDVVNARHVNIRIASDFDFMSTKSAGSYEKKEPTVLSRLIDDAKEGGIHRDDVASNQYDTQCDYDFLNNW